MFTREEKLVSRLITLEIIKTLGAQKIKISELMGKQANPGLFSPAQPQFITTINRLNTQPKFLF